MDSMDRKIEKKKGLALAFTKKALPFWGGALLLVFILWLIFRDDAKKLRIDADNVTIGTVISGEFNDYIRISGQVAPMTTIQISPLEGGVVQQIVTEEGSRVRSRNAVTCVNTCRRTACGIIVIVICVPCDSICGSCLEIDLYRTIA